MSYRLKTTWIITAVALVALAGCSSGTKSSDTDQPGDPTANAAPAGTDAVPPTAAADAAAPTDPNAPPPVADAGTAPADPNAAPATADPNAATPPPAGDAQAANAPSPTASATPDQAKADTSAPAAADSTAPATDLKTNASMDSKTDSTSTATASAASSTPADGGSDNYTVQSGDTLMKIAFENYGDLFKWHKIYDDNKDRIPDPNHVPPGTVLRIDKSEASVQVSRNGTAYLIKTGDTLGTISDDVYGTKTKWKRLWDNNRELIKDPNRIFAGFTLYYEMTPQDQQELEQFRGKPQPLAQSDADSARVPASQSPANTTKTN